MPASLSRAHLSSRIADYAFFPGKLQHLQISLPLLFPGKLVVFLGLLICSRQLLPKAVFCEHTFNCLTSIHDCTSAVKRPGQTHCKRLSLRPSSLQWVLLSKPQFLNFVPRSPFINRPISLILFLRLVRTKEKPIKAHNVMFILSQRKETALQFA